jgi:hypothetical protein
MGGAETDFNEDMQKWGVCRKCAPVSGTYVFDNELDALVAARKLFPNDDPCMMRDNYHTKYGNQLTT